MSQNRDPRLPAAGTVIVRKYKDLDVKVLVNESDFEYEGTKYTSLSKIAAELCGQKAVNGFAFFKLGESTVKKPRKAPDAATVAEPAAPAAAPAVEPAKVEPAPAVEPAKVEPAPAAAPVPVSLGDVAKKG